MSNIINLYHKLIGINKFLNKAFGLIIVVCFQGYSFAVNAADISVVELSNGSCWYQQSDEALKFVSFNEKKSLTITTGMIEEFNYQAIAKLAGPVKDISYQILGVTLHCGGYGASLVIKSKLGDHHYCSWLAMGERDLDIRSVGGLEFGRFESSLCDGYKPLELIVGLESKAQLQELKSGSMSPVIKSVTPITDLMVKIVIIDSFRGKEDEAIAELKKLINLKYIEYNIIQHQVGESVVLK